MEGSSGKQINNRQGCDGQQQSPGTHGQFMGDEFRSYMSRKIELQRRQFGLVLPPAPADSSSRFHSDQVDSKMDKLSTPSTKRGAKDDTRDLPTASSVYGRGDKCGSKQERKEDGLSGVLNRLKRRHGVGSTKLSSRKRRGRRESSERSTTESTEIEVSVHTRRHRPDLFFLGVVVLVNGFTTPDSATLMRMLQKHGGDLEKYETSRVTHIVASALSTAKALIYKRQRKPTPVVRPEWIVDSCKEGKLLPHANYLLEEVRDENAGSKTVESFFSCRQSPEEKSRASYLKESAPSTEEVKVRTVGTDPNFLDSYFSNSRLSFIGSFKQRTTAPEANASASANTSSPAFHRRDRTKAHRFVFHIDIDYFFAAVALRRYPQYRDKPVAVGHGWKADSNGQPVPVGSDASGSPNRGGSKKSYSELSTCNYAARKFGIRKGMFLHQANELCPNLIVLPYDYEGFEEVTSKVTEILYHHAEKNEGAVEQVSCDEAYLEIFLGQDDERDKETLHNLAKSLAETIRSEVFAATECTVSIGVAQNKFLAKLATDKAKPDGLLVVKEYHTLLEGLKLRDLPGIGWKLERKLQSHHLETVCDVFALGDEAEHELCSILGAGNGRKILNYIEGKDDRKVQAAPRKTIGAECNYGVRFDGPYGPDYMLQGLAKEVEKRMKAVNVNGEKITLKLLQRKEGASNPAKFLGHGSCNSLSRSCDLPVAVPTRDWSIMFRMGMKLFDELGVKKDDIRGMGIVISKLDNTGAFEDTGASSMCNWLKGGITEKDTEAMKGIEERRCSLNFESSSGSKRVVGDHRDEEEVPSQQVSQSRGDSAKLVHGLSERNIERRTVRFSTGIECHDSQSHGAPIVHPNVPASAETGRHSESPDASLEREEDFVIPTLSQIDEDVLVHLPKSIQRSVKRKLQFRAEKFNGPVCNDASSSIGSKVCFAAGEAFFRNGEEGELTPLSKGKGLSPPDDSDEVAPVLPTKGTANDPVDVCNDLSEGIVLPPLSQIDQNEVLALPQPMREEILKQISAKEESRRSNDSHVSLSPQNRFWERQEQSLTKQGTRKDTGGDGHFRQLSVKRMLKLASVKSGNDHLEESLGGESISLTQLESLPLEMQLQVANNDEAPVGTASHGASKLRNASHKTMPRRPDEDQRCHSSNAPPQGPANAPHSGAKSARFESSLQSSPTVPRIEESPSRTGILRESEEISFEPMQDFYHSNVLPLNKWMDKNPPSYGEIERIKHFFYVCMSEKRLDEVVKMLRVIRRRHDEWGGNSFTILLDAVDKLLTTSEGRKLDRRSLGLT